MINAMAHNGKENKTKLQIAPASKSHKIVAKI